MPIMRAPGAERRSPAAIAANAAKKTDSAAKKAEQAKAKDRIPTLDAYLAKANPNATDQKNQITLLTSLALETVKAVA